MRGHINGTLLGWDETGEGEVVLLIHGIAESRQSWLYQVEPFSRRYRVVACDLRGFGVSNTGEATGTLAQYAADVFELLARLDVKEARVVGFSMGGVIAQRFAIDHPEVTRAVVIAASSSVVGHRAAKHYLDRAELARARGGDAIRELSLEDARACFAFSPPEVVDAYCEVRRAAIQDPLGFANACETMASLRDRPLTEDLGGIRAPTLVITGERDAFCPPVASEIMHNKIRRSTLQIVPAAGHCLHWEDAGGFNHRVLDFLASA